MMHYRKYILLVFVILFTYCLNAQDTSYIRQMVNELCAPNMYGRGYVNKGDEKAAKLIRQQLKSSNVLPLASNYFQYFTFPMNTFPGKADVAIDGRLLKPVDDFIISPNSPSIKGTYALAYLPSKAETDSILRDSLSKIDYSGKMVVLDFKTLKLSHFTAYNCEGFVLTKQRSLWWGTSGKSVVDKAIILLSDSLINKPSSIKVNIQQKFHARYKSQNVTAIIPGSIYPDSMLVFTAHYDHLGLMGKGSVFNGANDNASGTALLLALAKYFGLPENRPKYSIAFLFFSAEERGLVGSQYYVEHPLFPLNQIKTLINLDMVGTGSDGIALVNGKENSLMTHCIQEINDREQYFNTIKVRENSCNSDHCHFVEQGVPAVFIYTMGDEFTAYHNLDDNAGQLPLTKMSELHQMMVEIVNDYSKLANRP